jgi:eukaryotic-like serine/threonine-protein kinase
MATRDPHTPGIGDLVAHRYRIESVIGTGGMAVVYRAVDEELGRAVALKVFRAEVVDAASVARQTEEIRLIASLDHPALVTLYDAVPGVDGDDHATGVLVMQLVEGRDLRHRIAEGGALESQTAAEIGADVAGALAYVHARGVIHRDVSPANVLLPDTREGGSPSARLADFGIARLIDSAGLTQTGTVIGTATYLSPEQAEGKPLGPSSDIYSLGLTLLEALTAERAFPGTAIESATARLSSDPVVPTSLGEEWSSLLADMTARDPQRRPQASEVAAVLADLAARPPSESTVATKLLPAAATEVLSPTAATEVLPSAPAPAPAPAPAEPAATAVLPAADRTQVLHRETTTTTPWTPTPDRRRAVVIIAGIAAALLIIVIALNLAGNGSPSQQPPTEAASSAAPSVEPAAEEPAEPVEPTYPAVEGDLGQSLLGLQQLVAYDRLDEELAGSLQQQVLSIATSAAAGDLEAAKVALESLRRAVDEARESGALDEDASRSIREAIDAVKHDIDEAKRDEKPGKGPKDDD